MEIKITGLEDTRNKFGVDDTITENGTARDAKGGTELMRNALYEKVDNALLDKFNIISSRVRQLSDDKPNILWCHDTYDDPEVQKLKDKNYQDKFAAFVFVSSFQMHTYCLNLGIPFNKCIVLRNAIDPIPFHEKPAKDDGPLNLIYHTTPHRGLNILCNIFDALYKVHGDNIHLNVFSSFKAYGWEERDEPFKPMFEFCKEHQGITYHGFQENDVIREALQNTHIFAYPNIWPETSCIAAIEALSAGCAMMCPNFYALPETTCGFAFDYPFTENLSDHSQMHANYLNMVIKNYWDEGVQNRLKMQKSHIDYVYNWERRTVEWEMFLNGMTQFTSN